MRGLLVPLHSVRAAHFSNLRSHRIMAGAGHNLPQEKPQVFADAVLELVRLAAPPRP